MSAQFPNDPSRDSPQDQPDSEWEDSRRAERMERRQARRERRAAGGSGWIGGAVLILLGIIFLLRNFGVFDVTNWWALFILIPAFGALATAWNLYRAAGNRLTVASRGPLVWGFVLLMVAFTFLFNLDFSLLLPLLLILGGVALLLNIIPIHR